MMRTLTAKTMLAATLFGLAFSPALAEAKSSLAKKPYHKIIERHAQKHGVPVRLAHAFVKVESNYNYKVRGRLGEVGLMQLMPSTARSIGYKGPMRALYNPETNITWGMKYLAMAYKKAGGDTCKTVMRYQSGLWAKKYSKWNRIYCSRVKQYLATI
ncbi:MAG: transglycosylase SLT domain-containing protein [Hyphomicrobiales bacterium]